MGIIEGCLGGYHPVCNDCGVQEVWEISPNEYNKQTMFWDNWCCQDCRSIPKKDEPYPVTGEPWW